MNAMVRGVEYDGTERLVMMAPLGPSTLNTRWGVTTLASGAMTWGSHRHCWCA
jgi:hypothetical protein